MKDKLKKLLHGMGIYLTRPKQIELIEKIVNIKKKIRK